MGFILQTGVLFAVILAVGLQLVLKDPIKLGLGLGKTFQPLSDFPYSCRRIEDTRLQACEDMWLSEATRTLFLACSDSLARQQWMPNGHHFNISGRSTRDAVVALDIDKPNDEGFEYRALSTPGFSGTAGDGLLQLVGLTGIDTPEDGKVELLLVNNRPPVDAVTGELLKEANEGANATIEVFEIAPAATEMKHIRTFANANISTPNNIAALSSTSFYFTNDCGDKKRGLGFFLSGFLGHGDVSYCSTEGCNNGNGKYQSAGELVGTLSKKAARELGLPEGIAVGGGVIDAYAGWIGTVGAKVELPPDHLDEEAPKNDLSQAFHRLAAVAGTSTCHLAMSREAVFVPGVWGPYRDVLLPEFWMAEGGQSATGELLRHILDIHPAYVETQALATAESKNIYDFLNAHLEYMREKANAPSISYLGRHFFFYGDLWGNRSPVADPNMKGAVIGLSSDKTTDNLALWYYATMEFIAMQTRQIVESMNNAGHVLNTIFMSGSQCQNPLLMDLMATICDMPVLVPRYVNAAVVHGAAMLGAKAATASEDGTTENLWSIMDRMSKPGKLVKPGTLKGEKFLFDAKYKVFLEQCKTQQEYRKQVDVAVDQWLQN